MTNETAPHAISAEENGGVASRREEEGSGDEKGEGWIQVFAICFWEWRLPEDDVMFEKLLSGFRADSQEGWEEGSSPFSPGIGMRS